MKVEIRLFDPAGARQPLPERFILNWDFELLERGGCATFSLTLAAELDDQQLPAVPAVNWRVEFWFGSDAAPIFRGWIEQPSPAIQEGAGPLKLTGTGLMGRCQTFLADYAYAKPYGADVAEVFADLAQRFLTGPERLGEFAQVIEGPLGYTLERAEFFGSSVRQAFDKLAEASEDLVLWGFDVAPDGRDRLYVRKRVTSVTSEDLRFRVGKDVAYLEQPEDLSTVVNAVHLIAGAAKTPNLIFNPSFELPNTPGDLSGGTPPAGNLLKDPSFSGGGGWTFGGGAAVKHTGDSPGVYARTGNTAGQLSSAGDAATQSVTLAATGADTPYLCVFHYATRTPGTATIHVRLWELNGATVVSTLIDQDVTVTSRSYQEFRSQVKLSSASTNKLELKISYVSGGPDVLVDDAFLFLADALVQDGWSSQNRGAAKALIHWANTESPYHGQYCVQATITGAAPDGNTIRIRATRDHWLSVRDKTTYVVRCRVKAAAALKLKIGFQKQGSGGGSSTVLSGEFTTAGAGAWETFEATLGTGSDATSIRPVLDLRSNGTYYLDAVEIFEAGIETRPDFLPGEALEYYFRADAPQVVRNDLQVSGSDATQVQSAGTPFSAADVGKTLRITGGTGWTPHHRLRRALRHAGERAGCRGDHGRAERHGLPAGPHRRGAGVHRHLWTARGHGQRRSGHGRGPGPPLRHRLPEPLLRSAAAGNGGAGAGAAVLPLRGSRRGRYPVRPGARLGRPDRDHRPEPRAHHVCAPAGRRGPVRAGVDYAQAGPGLAAGARAPRGQRRR